MKSIVTGLFLAYSAFNTFSQNPSFEWASNAGGTSSDVGQSVTTDNAGNVYTTGQFSGTADFDPGSGTFNLTSAGSHDIFVQKLDVSGNFVWAKRIGGAGSERGNSIAVDDAGNIYTTGYFYGTVDFDPGAGVYSLTATINTDIYIQKLDASGNFVWAVQMGGANTDYGNSIAIGPSGEIYTTGHFSGVADFDPGPGTFNLSSAGSTDIFISRLDVSGNLVWAKKIGGTGVDVGASITIDISGNLCVTGGFSGLVDFDPGSGSNNLGSNGDRDIFVQKLDAAGNFIWAKNMGGTGLDLGRSIVVDTAGNVYSTGIYEGTVDFDPGAGWHVLVSNGSWDVYVQKLDASGNFVWAKSVGGSNNDEGYSIGMDPNGDVYIAGYFEGMVDFDPGSGTFNLTSGGSSDIFIQKLNTSGNHIWSGQLGGSGSDRGHSVSINNQGSIYATGHFAGVADFDPETGVYNLTSNGDHDIFIVKLGQCLTSHTIDSQSACNSYTWIDGNTYSASTNTPTWTLTNSNGCDSIVTLNLTINNSNSGTDVQTACNSYTWIDGNTYSASTNTPTWTLTNMNGCDSLVTLNLTLNTSPDDNVTQTGTQLSSNAVGVQYQWLDCDDNFAVLAGQTGQTYTPAATGNYAVEVTFNGCSDTSACFVVDYTGLGETYSNAISVYPNPASEAIIIEGLSKVSGFKNLRIVSAQGKTVYRQSTIKNSINVAGLETGIYFVFIAHENGEQVLKFLIH